MSQINFELKELKCREDIYRTYEIYRHCMYMPTEDKFKRKTNDFLGCGARFFTCSYQNNPGGVIAVSFAENYGIEILGISVAPSLRGKGIGSYMIKTIAEAYKPTYIYAETDKAAVDFYKKNGFTVTESVETYGSKTIIRYKCELPVT